MGRWSAGACLPVRFSVLWLAAWVGLPALTGLGLPNLSRFVVFGIMLSGPLFLWVVGRLGLVCLLGFLFSGLSLGLGCLP